MGLSSFQKIELDKFSFQECKIRYKIENSSSTIFNMLVIFTSTFKNAYNNFSVRLSGTEELKHCKKECITMETFIMHFSSPEKPIYCAFN